MFQFVFFKQKTAYEMRISDWSSDVCSSDLTSTTIIASIATTKVSEPIITSRIWPRLRTPCTTNRLRPTGGVIRAVSSSTIIRILNHNGSKPMENITGVMIGNEAIIIDSDSMNMTSTRYRALNSHMVGHGVSPVEERE